MKAVVFAYNNIGCEGIRALSDAGIEISCVFTHKDAPEENIWFESVAQLCAERNLPVYAPDNINQPVWVEFIRKLNPNVLFSFYYRHILGKEILMIPPQGCLNLHGSLLPKYRGRCPINWAVINGETETGVTLHYMTTKPDAGAIVAQEKIPILAEDTALSVANKLSGAAKILLKNHLPDIINGCAKFYEQDDLQATYFGGRTPADGKINWRESAKKINNLVRGVTHPYPGAFTYLQNQKYFIWQSKVSDCNVQAPPGTIIALQPLTVACSDGALEIISIQKENDIVMHSSQLSNLENFRLGQLFDAHENCTKVKVLILGVNGFIGNAIADKLLQDGNYEIYGMDLYDDKLDYLLSNPRFHFTRGNVKDNHPWIEEQCKLCDIVLPLVAIATPVEYIRNPLKIFELDFEENLPIIRWCHKYHKRLIFPSTSEVYGMSEDDYFDEEMSHLILGPVCKSRWIYSCCKQMLDRVIYAYGNEGLKFTVFRPFNWIGPKLDSLRDAQTVQSRAITIMVLNLIQGEPITLVNGGLQKRCFTALSDGIECLYRIIKNAGNKCDGKIINIGNPDNEASIKDFAQMTINAFKNHPLSNNFPGVQPFKIINENEFYGNGYQDCQHRCPKIENAKKCCDWEPKINLQTAIDMTVDFFLRQTLEDIIQLK